MTDSDYSSLLLNWGVEFFALEGNRKIEGSPERTLTREVVRDTTGARWILERIEEGNLARKEQISLQLDALKASGLTSIHPYKKNREASCFTIHQNQHWMLRPFVEGIPLDRDSYLTELWRAESMAGFLIEMHSVVQTMKNPPRPVATPPVEGNKTEQAGTVSSSEGCRTCPPEPWRRRNGGVGSPVFSMPAYARGRMEVWGHHYPKLAKKLLPSFQTLEKRFFGIHDQLPTAFCHGDYHPLNMIWGEGRMESVIDWEFCGVKPEMYDVALLLGCLGFDDPDALIHDFVIQLVQKLRSANLYSASSWATLIDLMALIRTGWMAEWIRRSDEEAIEMEVLYIDILVDQKEYIEQRWS